jgi:hypothetical protein
MTLPLFIFQKILKLCDDIMVTFKVDADAQAKIQGSEDLEKHPIVAKVKGTGKDGALSVQVSGEDGSPLSARISGDSKNPVALGPIEVAPITIVPNLESAAKTIDLGALIGAFTKLSQGIKVEVANSGAPLSIAIGKIPVDLSISVSSPASETVFKVEIKGTVGE